MPLIILRVSTIVFQVLQLILFPLKLLLASSLHVDCLPSYLFDLIFQVVFQFLQVYVLVKNPFAILKGLLLAPKPNLLLKLLFFVMLFLDEIIDPVHQLWSHSL